MAISITNIGTNSNTSGATLAISSVTVPAGSLIVVLAEEATTTATPGTVADGTNSYSVATSGQNNAVGNIGSISYAANAPLSSGTITYTKHTSGNNTTISAFYATGIALTSPLDAAVTATAHGSSAAPTVTSGTPGATGELFVAFAGFGGSGQSFTQDTTDGWATPPNTVLLNSTNLGGGTQVNAGAGTIKFAPTIGTSSNWFAAVVGFQAAAATFITPGPLIVGQESAADYPRHPRSLFLDGIPGPNVAPPPMVADRLLIRQETPDHPRSALFPGIPPAGLIPSRFVRDWLIVPQETPFHPRSMFDPGVPGPNVRGPARDTVLIAQELPDYPRHPLPLLRAGRQGPNVATPDFVNRALLVRQELPWHPPSFLFTGQVPVNFEDRQFFVIV